MKKPKNHTKDVNSVLAMMRNLRSGEVFYTYQNASMITTRAHSYKIKVSTQSCVVIEDKMEKNPTAKRVTKVTIL